MSYAYYRWFPGDYQRDTMHLGWYEDLAYRRLIDLYNSLGHPIRNDRAYIMRAVRAAEPEQQAAVDTVLAEFFFLKPDGWHQMRCDAEIRYRRGIKDSTKRAANARWNRNNINTMDACAMQTQSERITNQNQNQNEKEKQYSGRDRLSVDKSKTVFKKIPPETNPAEVERNRAIADAVKCGDIERAKLLRDRT